MPLAVLDERRNCDDGYAVLASELQGIIAAEHGAVVMHQLSKQSHASHAAQAAQVVRGFGVARALEDAPGARAEREEVPRLGEGLCRLREVTEGTSCCGTICC